MHIYLGMEEELLVVTRRHGQWQAESQLTGIQITCLASDPERPERVYCGTSGSGLFRTKDAGITWKPVGEGIGSENITAIAVSAVDRAKDDGVVYAGTELSAMFRSEDGGNTWRELKAFTQLPSAPTWSFPPRPDTNHVRWITPDPLGSGRVFVAVEAGALVRSMDGGEHWEDRRPDAPYDTHTLVMHFKAPDRLYSAAGDGYIHPGTGYNESQDGGNTWLRPDEGLKHNYLVSVAVDPADPDTIVVSAAASPAEAHSRFNAQSFIYRKQDQTPWQRIAKGLPEAKGMIVPILATNTGEPHVFYALTNKALYRSPDAGQHWEQMNIPWKREYQGQHQQAILVTDSL